MCARALQGGRTLQAALTTRRAGGEHGQVLLLFCSYHSTITVCSLGESIKRTLSFIQNNPCNKGLRLTREIFFVLGVLRPPTLQERGVGFCPDGGRVSVSTVGVQHPSSSYPREQASLLPSASLPRSLLSVHPSIFLALSLARSLSHSLPLSLYYSIICCSTL